MAKCPNCNARKAKRKCLVTDSGEICSLCCGQIRQASTCEGCPYWQPPQARRDYAEVPAFTTVEMEANTHLLEPSMVLEGAIVGLDRQSGLTLRDEVPIRIYERLLDRQYYDEEPALADDEVVVQGERQLSLVIERELRGLDHKTLVKLLATLRLAARRRTRGRREYLDLVGNFIGGLR